MIKLGVIFGGISTEHLISVVSGTSVLKNLNKTKYEIYPIYISEDGKWYQLLDNINTIEIYKIGAKPTNIKIINNVFNYLKKLDVLFPVLHGLGGEDGSIQGLFTIINKPFVGCGILASSLCMDKVYTKIILNKAGINVVPDLYLKQENNKLRYVSSSFDEIVVDIDEINKLIIEKLAYPVFVKPSNSGSSLGVSKTHNINELKKSIKEALKYDSKVLIEKAIVGKELECAILGNIASSVGEVLSAENFYTFEAKYKNQESKTVIPAKVDFKIMDEIKLIALKAFKAVGGSNLSRVDFFVEENTNKIYLNEINTLPGFTEISMYPKLIENIGITYTELLDKLIDIANDNLK